MCIDSMILYVGPLSTTPPMSRRLCGLGLYLQAFRKLKGHFIGVYLNLTSAISESFLLKTCPYIEGFKIFTSRCET